MKFNTLTIYLILPLGFIIGSCDLYPDSKARVEDLDLVITVYDDQANFQTYNTYAIVDTVRQITDDTVNVSSSNDPIDQEINDLILLSIETNMTALGYQKVDQANQADLAINVGIIVNEFGITGGYPIYKYYYPPYWYCSGYYWGYPGYGYGYPYPPVYRVQVYKVGTLIIDIIDLGNVNIGDQTIATVWTGTIIGLLESNTQDLKKRIKDGIDQAFEDSPYLIKN